MFKVTVITILSILLLSGCDSSSGILEKAKSANDPLEAYKLLSAWDSSIYEDDDVHAAMIDYLFKSAEQMNTAALKLIYTRYPYLPNSKKLAPKILAVAESSKDQDVVLLAGQIVASDSYVIKDSIKAVSLLTKAWVLGSEQAAEETSVVYSELHDDKNAYLWALRCTGSCTRSISDEIKGYESKLSTEMIKHIQAAAKDKSILSI